MKRTVITLLILLAGMLQAQWSSDPMQNNAICDLNGQQAIPKVVNGPTGDTYIGFFSNNSGNYDVRLQRLDSEGNELWDHNGILISDNPAMSWLTDWDMTVDADNHAILVFQDIRNADNNNIYAYRISPDGTFGWGANGLALSSSPAFSVSPKVVVTSSGNIVVAWQEDSVSLLQKISPDGTLLWGTAGITISSANTISWPQPFAVDNDQIMVKYFDDSGLPYAPTRHCYLQKFDSAGNPLWTNPTIISNAGGISAWTQIFPIISDGDNGCFITWHDSRGGGSIAYPFVQHVLSDGSLGFAANGVQLSTQAGRQNFYPESVFNEISGELTTYWFQTDADQNNWGITGQKLDTSGNLLWGSNGLTIFPISNLYVLPFAVRKANENTIILYEEGINAVNSYLKATKLDMDGNFVWTANSVTMCSVSSSKVHIAASFAFQEQLIAAWEDDRSGNSDIYAQNINFDGTIGCNPIELNPPQNIIIDPNTGYISWEQPEPTPGAELLGYNLFLDGVFLAFLTNTFFQLENLINGIIYTIGISAVYDLGESEIVETDFIYIGTSAENNLIMQPCLIGNYPNPFNPSTTIRFSIEQNQQVKLIIYNIKGQMVKQFLNEELSAGQHTIEWDGTDEKGKPVTSGVYFYNLRTDNFSESKKMLLLR